MSYTLIIGPMKSGKSLELIARVAPYEFANKKILFVQSSLNVRDEKIASRLGVNIKALKVKSLKEIKSLFDVIGIDEVHMFDTADAEIVKKWLHAGKEVFISGLDLDYQGKLMPIIKRLLELKPDHIINKMAVCEICQSYSAIFSQLMKNNEPVLGGLPPSIPDDGTYDYGVRCRNCFISLE